MRERERERERERIRDRGGRDSVCAYVTRASVCVRALGKHAHAIVLNSMPAKPFNNRAMPEANPSLTQHCEYCWISPRLRDPL